jgi:hypothetical protein
MEHRGGLLQVQEDWQEYFPRKPSSCIAFLEDNLAGDNGSEELYPSLSRLGRTSL